MSAVLAFVLMLWLAPAASGAAPSRPLDELVAARGVLKLLAGEARSDAAKRAVAVAELAVARSTAPTLWLDPGHLVAPSYGLSVFSDSRAAISALEHVPGAALPAGSVAGVETQILAADRALAEGEIFQAREGAGGLLARAGGMVLSGDRWAATSRRDLAAEQYGAGWRDAFAAMTELVVLRASTLSPAEVAAAAKRALRSRAIAPAGVRVLGSRPNLKDTTGLPEILFVGTESCRFCAVERWGLVVALSRFGTFSNLELGQSATTTPPVLRSFTLAGLRYESPYVSFVPVELSSDVPRPGGGYERLGRLTPAQRTVLGRLDTKASVPFVDVAGVSADAGSTVSPLELGDGTWPALAGSLRNPRTPSAQAVAATAEVLTGEICRATGGAPSAVCESPVVRDYTSRLARFARSASGCRLGAREMRRVTGRAGR